MNHEVIIIGSGAGGSAVAFHLAKTGRKVLLLEKGMALPRDGSTLDVDTVLKRGAFLADEPWVDSGGKMTVPEEHFNLGGKTKWYGAALLRFAPHEFLADPEYGFLGWPFAYEELAPFYTEAERLLGVRSFPIEADFQRIAAGLVRQDPLWRKQQMSLGLAPDILAHPHEAKHFDAFASVLDLKADAENTFLARVAKMPNLEIITGKAVKALLPDAADARRVRGVECEDGTRYEADTVILAAGALHSPRLLQTYLESSLLNEALPCYRNVGRYYKSHILTAMLAFSHRRVHDVLCKTLLMLHEALPHSTLQTLGGNLAAEIVRTQLGSAVPEWLSSPVASRVYGLFLQTEDASHPDNRILARDANSARPQIDYLPARSPKAVAEHSRLIAMLKHQLLSQGYLTVAKPIPVSGTAHACGTLVTGKDPSTSVVDPSGKVHGLANLYVADGSVLPRSSRVNPALTIYAWGLRLASLLGRSARGESGLEAGAALDSTANPQHAFQPGA